MKPTGSKEREVRVAKANRALVFAELAEDGGKKKKKGTGGGGGAGRGGTAKKA